LGRALPINRGLWNFDEIRFNYYRDANAYHEAFKRGLFDVRTETDPAQWQTAYDFPAVRDGRVDKESFTSGLQGDHRIGAQIERAQPSGLMGHPMLGRGGL
jgi:peptide/nickel transport system substrate-binding protein